MERQRRGRKRGEKKSPSPKRKTRKRNKKQLLPATVEGIYICYAQSTDSDHPRILLRKPRIRAFAQ